MRGFEAIRLTHALTPSGLEHAKGATHGKLFLPIGCIS